MITQWFRDYWCLFVTIVFLAAMAWWINDGFEKLYTDLDSEISFQH